MILRANCKINLGLDILRRRADGYHDLETVMFPVRGLYDEVEVVRTAGAGVDFRAEGLAVDCEPGQNICIKAFRLMHDRYGVDGVSIRLDKRVPFGAGLGGGSSDGTAVLLALDRLFDLHLSEAEPDRPRRRAWAVIRRSSCATPRSSAPDGARSCRPFRSALGG